MHLSPEPGPDGSGQHGPVNQNSALRASGSSPRKSSPIAADGKIFLTGEDGPLKRCSFFHQPHTEIGGNESGVALGRSRGAVSGLLCIDRTSR